MANYHVIIPSAGAGSRMQTASPKQYLALHGKPVLRYAIDAFEAMPEIANVFIAIAKQDDYWQTDLLDGCQKTEVLLSGGTTRAETVLNSLQAIAKHIAEDDWVLVHDAARPGIDTRMVRRLINSIQPADIGGILALPLADTLKRADTGQCVVETIPRDALWQAQTPQMFKAGNLRQALETYIDRQPTDEAQAIEWMGHAPKLVLGDLKNMKITYPQDLTVVSALMQASQVQEIK